MNDSAINGAINELVEAAFEEGADQRYHVRQAQQLLIAAMDGDDE